MNIDDLRAELESAPVTARKPSARSIVMSLMPVILKKRAEGFSIDDLVAFFAVRGVTVTRNTLHTYIAQYQKKMGAQTSTGSAGVEKRTTAGGFLGQDNPFRRSQNGQAALTTSFVRDYENI